MIEFVKDQNTLLLLHGENFADSSGNGHSITNNGVTISTSQSKFGGSSFYFDGGSYIKADISGAKTVDFWLYTNTATASGKYPVPFSMSLSGVRTNVQIDDSTSSLYPVYRVIIDNVVNGGNGSAIISRGTWHHLAYCYDGNSTHSFYLDGVLQKQFNVSVGDYVYLVLGAAMNYDGAFDAKTYFTGYIDEIRVSDVVRWTEDFTPPTEPYPDSSIAILPGGVLPIQYALRRRMMMTIQAARLPKEYQEVEYIQSSGTQYIDTGISPSENLTTQVVFIPDASAMTEHAIFGSTWSANGYFMMFYQNSLRWHSGGKSVDVSNFETASKNTIICTHTGLTVNGTLHSISPTGSDSTNTIYLFATQGAMSGNKGIYKLVYCAMSLSGALVREFIPCYRKADSIAGLYDLANNTFYTNAGSGVFVVGPDVSGSVKPSTNFDFAYTGDYVDNRLNGTGTIRFNASGTLEVTGETVVVSAVIQGAGGGGAAVLNNTQYGFGGSGGRQTVTVVLTPGTYDIIIGSGGAAAIGAIGSGTATASDGGDTSAFGYTATGGTGGKVSGEGVDGANGSPDGGSINGGMASMGSATNGGDGYVELIFA